MPSEAWPTVVDAGRVVPTVANVWAYVEENDVDEHIPRFLPPDGNTPTALQAVDVTAES